jgi:amino acid transporter
MLVLFLIALAILGTAFGVKEVGKLQTQAESHNDYELAAKYYKLATVLMIGILGLITIAILLMVSLSYNFYKQP